MGLSDSKGKGIQAWDDGPKGGERGRPIPQRPQVAPGASQKCLRWRSPLRDPGTTLAGLVGCTDHHQCDHDLLDPLRQVDRQDILVSGL